MTAQNRRERSSMSEMINLKIDGIDVEVPKGTTILQAAKKQI